MKEQVKVTTLQQITVFYIAVVSTSAGVDFSLYVAQEFLEIFLAGHHEGNASQVSGSMLM